MKRAKEVVGSTTPHSGLVKSGVSAEVFVLEPVESKHKDSSAQTYYYERVLATLPEPFRSLPWELSRFAVKMRKLFRTIELNEEDDSQREDIEETGRRIRFIPDAFCVDTHHKVILLAEIIETNPISDEKACGLGHFAFDVVELTDGWGVGLVEIYPREARCIFVDCLSRIVFESAFLDGRNSPHRDAYNTLPKSDIRMRAVAA